MSGDGQNDVASAAPAASACTSDRVLVLDFGSQYSHLIVRRLREIGVYSELRRCDIPLSEIKDFRPAAIILSGGPSSVYEDDSPHVAASFFAWAEQQKVPLLGICYGLQEMCHSLGGEVQNGAKREFGSTWINVHCIDGVDGTASDGDAIARDDVTPSCADSNGRPKEEAAAAAAGRKPGATQHSKAECDLFYGCIGSGCAGDKSFGKAGATPEKKKHKKEGDLRVWMSHGDKVTRIPPGFTVLASSAACHFAAIGDASRRFYGLQFHPEVTHTPQGTLLLRNFALHIAKMRPSWTMKMFLRSAVEDIHRRVGDDFVVLGALSGGVDSTVAAALVCRAVGKRFRGVLIDTGLLRQNEATTTLAALRSTFADATVECVDARAAFLSALKGVQDPEEKRKIVGKLFVEHFEAYVKQNNIVPEKTLLLQGTLYPDVIESSSYKGPSHTIKTHHNVGGLPEKMHMKVLEPLRELFKDEVRQLGLELGLSHERIYRHPFPGPGLAVRIVGEVTAERVAVLQQADAIFIEEIRASGLYDQIAQAFVVLLPGARSVGVMGDCRTYEWTCALRAVESEDYMTADWSRLPYDLVARVSSRIINEVRGVNRVVLDVSSKPPATIEWE